MRRSSMEGSIAAAFVNHNIGSGQSAVAKDFLARRREIGPLARLRRRSLGNDAGNDRVALPEFHGLSGTQPCFQTLGVSKFTNVYARHI